MPHKERMALKRHDRHFKKQVVEQHEAHLAAIQKHEEHLRVKQHRLAAKKTHHSHLAQAPTQTHPTEHNAHAASEEARLAKMQSKRQSHFTKVQTQHQEHLAKLEAQRQSHFSKIQTQHQARLAKIEAQHQAHFAKTQAQHEARLANQQAARNARMAAHNAQVAAHNARMASQRSHWVAMHGDGSGGRHIRFWQTVAAGVPVKVISVDLNNSDVKVSGLLARNGSGSSEPFRQMISRANPNVAVTGTFFSLDNLQPVGDIVIDGNLVHFGGMGTALCITPDNKASMVTVQWGRHHDWSPYDFVCACGPRLLRRGQVALDPRAERFRDRHMLAPNSRIAVGITRGNTVVFAMTHKAIYLGRLAKVMRALGASEAMNLDAGTSTGFYYNGTTLAKPGRKLTNMIVVYGRKDRYERALHELVPAGYHRAWPGGTHRQVSKADTNRWIPPPSLSQYSHSH